MKRAVAVLFVLATLMAVQGQPENDEPTQIEESECYDCHKAGGEGSGPILQEMFRMFMAAPPDLTEGASTELSFDIINWWTSEMRGFSGYIDLTEAPALSFEAARDPITGAKEDELPPYQPVAFYQGQERSVRFTVDVEPGGTEFILSVKAEEDSDADILLRIWEPGTDPDTATPTFAEVDKTDGGEPESFAIRGDPVLGGTYTIDVVERPNTFAADIGMFDEIGVSLDWTLLFEFTAGDPVRSGAVLDVLDGQDDSTPQSALISWPINVIDEITTEQRIRVYMESAAYYDHPAKFNAADEWLFWNDVEYVIAPQADGTLHIQRQISGGGSVTEYIVGEQGVQIAEPLDEGPDLTVEVDPPFVEISEIVGYASAFLLVISLLTGGAFGNWSRKFQQWMLYRRAKKRVAYHNVISYGVILTATVHMVLFLVEPKYPWSVGFFLGGVSIVGMYLAGITGLYQRGMVRAMGHEGWRWLHFLSFVLAFSGAIAHILLDGIHFLEFQDMAGWVDPVAPALEEWIPSSTGSGS